MTEVGISATLHNGIGFLCRSFTHNILCYPYGEPNHQFGGNTMGLPSSTYLTGRVRFCLFAGGIIIHVTRTIQPVNYTPCHFGYSVSSSFAICYVTTFISSSPLLTIPAKPNSSAPDDSATGLPHGIPLKDILSGQLRTNQLPNKHVSVGYL